MLPERPGEARRQGLAGRLWRSDCLAATMAMMRAAAILLIILLMMSFPLAGEDSRTSGDAATFSVSVNLIKVPVTVLDKTGGTIAELRREDFRLYEDGIPQQIRSFGIDRNPVSVVLLLDVSATVERELKHLKEAAQDFAQALSPEDRISIIAFADDVALIQDWTSDIKHIRKALRKIQPGVRTALYDAMYMAAQEQLKGVDGRKAIILLTDCLNNQSSIGLPDAALSIVQSQASLYVVSKTIMVREAARTERRVMMLTDIYRRMFGEGDYIDEFFRKRETEMNELAEKTGGRCFFPSSYDAIRGVYSRIAQELKSKHYITYISNQPKSPGTYHSISLEYLPPAGDITYRRGYYFEPRPIHKRRY
jgi:VWFA-related protein